jgi:hypothetical protein
MRLERKPQQMPVRRNLGRGGGDRLLAERRVTQGRSPHGATRGIGAGLFGGMLVPPITDSGVRL